MAQQGFESLAERLDLSQVADAGGGLQAVSAAEGVVEVGPPVRARVGVEGSPDAVEVFAVLLAERLQELVAQVAHSRYLPAASWSCRLRALTLTTAASSWDVAEAVWVAAWRMSFMPCVTWSSPICCWL